MDERQNYILLELFDNSNESEFVVKLPFAELGDVISWNVVCYCRWIKFHVWYNDKIIWTENNLKHFGMIQGDILNVTITAAETL